MSRFGKIFIGYVAMITLLCIFVVSHILTTIEEAGGMREIIIESGKEVKEILKEIEDE